MVGLEEEDPAERAVARLMAHTIYHVLSWLAGAKDVSRRIESLLEGDKRARGELGVRLVESLDC